MWTKGNYRRVFLDMHIGDSNDVYLSKLDPEHIVHTIKESGAQMLVVKCRPHTGLALFPTKIGRMHKGLKGRDYVGEMIQLCHKNGIAVQAYFSQNFDNWAYENHPDWRMINCDGKTSMEKEDYYNATMFSKGRYGLVCPNNEDYRAYVKDCLTELTENYQFESIFLDMPFWPEVCYCPSCKKKYYEATGKELPRIIDWSNDDFKKWQLLRERWMGEFAEMAGSCIKQIRPEVTIEQNLSVMVSSWVYGSSEWIADTCDYAGGDLYGGFLEESFICKYYRNLSKTLPFEFITSRCDPSLSYHTTTKSEEELLLHMITALFHNGAISVCDGMNPDGTIADHVYSGVLKRVFTQSEKYDSYVDGDLITDVAIWYPTHSKCSWSENGTPIESGKYCDEYIETELNMARILRQEHFLFNVIPSGKISQMTEQVFILSNVVTIQDDEMDAIEEFVKKGGHLFISGHIGHPRLYELLEAEDLGMTKHAVTYMSPTEEGKEIFEGFTKTSPLNVQSPMEQVRFHGEHTVLATLTLPYTLTGTKDFSSIHSNPPGIFTDLPAAVIKSIGKGKILWTAAALENSRPYMSKQVVGRLVSSLVPEKKLTVHAPACVEVMAWKKGSKTYLGILNEQEHAPFIPISQLTIDLPFSCHKAICLDTGETLSLETTAETTTLSIPPLEVFHLIELE
jgi:hypothetical protein